jgi:uncharacterized protein YggU (UPF0235/DUF167 family)
MDDNMNRGRTEKGNGRNAVTVGIETAGAPWTRGSGKLIIACRLTPRGGRNAIDGAAQLADGSRVLHARVREPPEDGRANRALCALLALTLDVSISSVMIVAGGRGRAKRVAVSGDPEILVERLRALLAFSPPLTPK